MLTDNSGWVVSYTAECQFLRSLTNRNASISGFSNSDASEEDCPHFSHHSISSVFFCLKIYMSITFQEIPRWEVSVEHCVKTLQQCKLESQTMNEHIGKTTQNTHLAENTEYPLLARFIILSLIRIFSWVQVLFYNRSEAFYPSNQVHFLLVVAATV